MVLCFVQRVSKFPKIANYSNKKAGSRKNAVPKKRQPAPLDIGARIVPVRCKRYNEPPNTDPNEPIRERIRDSGRL